MQPEVPAALWIICDNVAVGIFEHRLAVLVVMSAGGRRVRWRNGGSHRERDEDK